MSMDLLRRGRQAVDRAVSLHDRALELEERGQPYEALLLAAEASRLLHSTECASPLDVANVLLCLSRLYRFLGQQAEGQVAIRECLAILEDVEPALVGQPQSIERDRLWVRASVVQGQLESDKGDYRAAVKVLRGALRQARATFRPFEFDHVAVVCALGVVCKYTGQFEAAEDLYQQALRGLGSLDDSEADSAAAERQIQRASLLHNLGGLEHARGNFQRAEPLAREALELRERTVGSEHIETAAERAALAAILVDSGRLEEARELYLLAIEVFERTLGANHYEVAVNLAGLAVVEQASGRLEEAEALYRQSVELHLLQLGPDHPETALTLNNHGALLIEMQRLEEAERVLQRAHEVLEMSLGLDHPHCQACHANLSAIGATPLVSMSHP